MKPVVRTMMATIAITVLIFLAVVPTFAAGPPDLTLADSQVAVRSDGSLGITYKLSFRETEGRSQITTLGPLDAGHSLRSSEIEGSDGKRSQLSLSSKGGGLDRRTR